MHTLKHLGFLLIGFLAGFFAVGIPYWSVPYNEVSVPNTLMTAGLLVVVLASLLLRALGAASIWEATLIVGISVPGAVLARVNAETATDPTSHNLWPFEIVFASAVGLPAALAGALIGSLVARLLARRIGNGRS
jgi:hypothetical protein